jgi:hypothetical protein
MRKFTLLCAFLFSACTAFNQSKWFFSFSAGIGLGGPMSKIKNNMEEQGLAQVGTPIVSGLPLKDRSYPDKKISIPVLIIFGKIIIEGRSIYFEAGVSNKGKITGVKNSAVFSDLLTVNYSVTQLTAGYQYSSALTKSKFGIGPSAYIFNYKESVHKNERHSSLVPGVSLFTRTPVIDEGSLSIDLVLQMNLAPPATMKEINYSASSNAANPVILLKESRVNMVHGVIGLALSIRNKK